jgi:hypothetical protein
MRRDTSLIINRIKLHLGFKTDTELAKFLGTTQSNIATWKKRHTMNYDLIIAKCPEIDANWLLTGEGEMIKKELSSNKVNRKSIKQLEVEDIFISKNDLDILEREYGFFPDIDMVKSYLTLSESRLKNILSSLKADLREKIATNNNISLIAEKLMTNRDSYYRHRFKIITEKEYMKGIMEDFDPSRTSFEDVKLKWIALIYTFQSSNEHLTFITANMMRYLKMAVDSGLRLGFIQINESLINKISNTDNES